MHLIFERMLLVHQWTRFIHFCQKTISVTFFKCTSSIFVFSCVHLYSFMRCPFRLCQSQIELQYKTFYVTWVWFANVRLEEINLSDHSFQCERLSITYTLPNKYNLIIICLFCSVISNCIQLLVQDLENACDAPLTALIKVQFSTINSPYRFMANLTWHVIRVQDMIILGKASWLRMEFSCGEIKQMYDIKKWEFRCTGHWPSVSSRLADIGQVLVCVVNIFLSWPKKLSQSIIWHLHFVFSGARRIFEGYLKEDAATGLHNCLEFSFMFRRGYENVENALYFLKNYVVYEH